MKTKIENQNTIVHITKIIKIDNLNTIIHKNNNEKNIRAFKN